MADNIDEHQFLLEVLRGDEAAVNFCEVLFRISQIADDLYDKDKEVTRKEVEEVFWLALVQLPNHPFYQKHFSYLQPLIQAVYVDWMDANVMERSGNEQDKRASYILRDSVGCMAVHVAYLVGGFEWGKVVGAKIRRFIYDEPFDQYVEGFEK